MYFAQLPSSAELFIMATVAATITDLMYDNVSWNYILHNFGLLDVEVTKFTDDYSTGRELMVYNPTHIKDVINQQNNIYLNYAGPNQCGYINATMINRIFEFHLWAGFSVKYSRVEYYTVSSTASDCDWLDYIID